MFKNVKHMQPKSTLCRVLIQCWWTLSLLLVVDGALAQDDTKLGHWRFERDLIDGQQLQALVGDNGTIQGAAKLDTQLPASLVLDGLDDWVIISDNLEQAALPVRAMTVESWVRIDAPKKWGAIATAMQDNGSYERGWLLGNRDAKFCFGISSIDRKRLTYLSADEAFVAGRWYYVVATYDGKTMRLYVDGRLAAESLEQSGDIFYPERGVFGLGAYRDDNEFYPCAGRLAEVQLHKKVLTAPEISSRFDAGKSRFPAIEVTVTQVVGWPTYMHDNTRSGQTGEHLTLPLNRHWSYQSRYPLAPAWPLPAKQNFWRNQSDLPARVAFDRALQVVSDGRHVLFGSTADDRVVCLDIATGREKWSYATEGPVRFAPALQDGKAYVGSDDGHLYCLSVSDGRLVWRFRTGPRDHRIPGNGRMISLWPIRSGVIINNGHARFAAGLFPNQGTYQYALDATTGKLLAEGQLAFSPQGYMQLQGNAIKISQGRAPSTVLAKLEHANKTSIGQVKGISAEFPFAWIGTAEHLIGGGDGKVAAFTKTGQEVWRGDVIGRAYGLAFADGKLLVSTDQGHIYCFGSPLAQVEQTETDQRKELAAPSPSVVQTARFVKPHFKNRRGYCLLLGEIDPAVTTALVEAAGWRFVCRPETLATADETRARLDAAHLANRAAMHQGGPVPLPYGSGLFNVVIVPSGSKTLGAALIAEVARVLRPAGGKALVRLPEGDVPRRPTEDWLSGIADRDAYDHELVKRDGTWLVITRKTLRGAGQWTHLYASPSNTACSDDEQIDDQLTLQWFGQPGPREMVDRHHRTVSPLYCDGRLFVPGNERFYGVDAYNGTLLWEVQIPRSRRVAIASDCGSMAATPDTLYIVAGESCHRIEAVSGQALVKFEVPSSGNREARDWGYVAAVGDILFGSTTRPNASRSGHSRKQISEAYYDAVPLVTSDSVFAVERHTGERRWQYRATAGAIVNPTITIGGNRLYFVESGNPETLREASGRSKLKQLVGSEHGATLVALDLKDGSVAWQAPIHLGNIEHHLFLSYAKNKLIVVGTRNQTAGTRAFVWYDTHCVNAEDGKLVWTATQDQRQSAGGSHGEQDHHPIIVGDTVYVEPYAYHLATGQRTESWSLGRGGHGCGSISASAKMCFFRAGNPTMCELASGLKTKVTRVSRPGCWINMIPAGGLLLIPEASSGCVCDFPIQASMAFASRALSGRGNGQ
jgi:outer membrane protein assembly factor BamB